MRLPLYFSFLFSLIRLTSYSFILLVHDSLTPEFRCRFWAANPNSVLAKNGIGVRHNPAVSLDAFKNNLLKVLWKMTHFIAPMRSPYREIERQPPVF